MTSVMDAAGNPRCQPVPSPELMATTTVVSTKGCPAMDAHRAMAWIESIFPGGMDGKCDRRFHR